MSAQDRLRRRQKQKAEAQRRQAEFDAAAEAAVDAALEAEATEDDLERGKPEADMPGPSIEALDESRELRADVEDPTAVDLSHFQEEN